MSSSPHIDDSSRPMPTRLLTSLKRPFSRPKNDHDRHPSSSERTHGPIHREAPPNYQQIAMGLHLSRTPHLPAHLAPTLYPPTTAAARLQRSASVPTRPRPQSQSQSQAHLHSRSHSNSPPPPSTTRPSRLLPPPTRSALKKPTTTTTTTTSSSVTPDTASASTVASSGPPLTPTRFSASGGGGGGGLLARFLGKERGRAAAAGMTLVVPQRTTSKAVRFGGLEEESES